MTYVVTELSKQTTIAILVAPDDFIVGAGNFYARILQFAIKG